MTFAIKKVKDLPHYSKFCDSFVKKNGCTIIFVKKYHKNMINAQFQQIIKKIETM